MTPEEAIQYFNDEIRLCRAAPSINGCQMTEDWQRTIDACEISVAAIRKVQELEQAEQDGRLVVLPCKVGATVYGHSKAEVFEYKVAVISLATYNWYLRCQNHNSDFWVTDADIGKTVFLTREEAEAALKGGDLPENRTDRR